MVSNQTGPRYEDTAQGALDFLHAAKPILQSGTYGGEPHKFIPFYKPLFAIKASSVGVWFIYHEVIGGAGFTKVDLPNFDTLTGSVTDLPLTWGQNLVNDSKYEKIYF